MGELKTIHETDTYKILDAHEHFIVVNKKKDFSVGHTHITNYKTALWIIKLASEKKIPNHLPIYLIDSMIRISTEQHYIDKLERLKSEKLSQSKMKYHNKSITYKKYKK